MMEMVAKMEFTTGGKSDGVHKQVESDTLRLSRSEEESWLKLNRIAIRFFCVLLLTCAIKGLC